MRYSYKTSMVCASEIQFELQGDTVKNVQFIGGCNGNLKAIAKLVDGWEAQRVIETLKGNTCGRRPTSCADQLVKAIESVYCEH